MRTAFWTGSSLSCRPLGVGSADRTRHNLTEAKTEPQSHSLTGSTTLLLCGILDRLSGFELHIGVHVADRPHA